MEYTVEAHTYSNSCCLAYVGNRDREAHDPLYTIYARTAYYGRRRGHPPFKMASVTRRASGVRGGRRMCRPPPPSTRRISRVVQCQFDHDDPEDIGN